MNQLNPVEAISGAHFKLLITVSGAESAYTFAKFYIDGTQNTAVTCTYTSGVITVATTSFSTGIAGVGDHTYSVTLSTSTTSSGSEQVIVYKNALKVYSPVNTN